MQRRHLLIGALVALPLLAVGGVAAFAASGGSSGTSPAATFISDVANRLGISTSTLESAVQQARLDQVQKMEDQGRLTAAQAAKMEAAIKSGRLPAGFGGMRRGGRMMAGGAAMRAAAAYLGLTQQQLASDLGAGKSLSDVATSQSGKTVGGLEAAITAALQQQIQQAVADGRLTQQQATDREQNLETLVARLVTRTGMGRGHPGAWGPPPASGGAPSSD